jgi:hypothetical protein
MARTPVPADPPGWSGIRAKREGFEHLVQQEFDDYLSTLAPG